MSRCTRKPAAAALALAFSLTSVALAAPTKELVSAKTIQELKALTSVDRLSNGIAVVYRQVPGSDIMQVNVNFAHGLKDLPPGRKALNEWMWATLPMAGQDHPKQTVFGMIEKLGLDLGCTGGIEMSTCTLGLVDDFWKDALPLLSGVLLKPAFTDEDIRLTKERLTAQYKNIPSDPGNYINEIVNSVYYPVGHPYRLNHDEALKELAKLNKKDLLALHQKVLNASLMQIVVVSSLPKEQVLKDLEQNFGKIAKTDVQAIKPQDPVFNERAAYAFHNRDLPTAYIRIKLGTPGVNHPDGVATRLLYEILSEELGDLIRTKRSLSYSVYAAPIQYSLGIGVISVSTSKPKETLQAIEEVLKAIKERTYSDEELDEYRHVFATNYFLTQETHGALASTLGTAMHYFGDPNELYEMPRKLDKVTPADIRRLANEQLANLRMGVIYGKANFKEEWARGLIKRFARAPKKTN